MQDFTVNGRPLKVIIADDHSLFREILRDNIQKIEGLEVIAEAGDGLELLGLLKESDPNLIILDIGMPNLSGIEATKQIKKLYPHIRVLMLTEHKSSDYVYRAIAAGADGYLLKENAYADLIAAIESIKEGKKYISSLISTQVADIIRWQLDEGEGEHPKRLTAREMEVLRHIARGKTSKEIAELLSISDLTVYNHRVNIKKKLKIKRTADLIKYAIQHGYI